MDSCENKAEIEKAIAHIGACIEDVEMRWAWRNVRGGEGEIEEYYEFWVKR